MNALWSTNTLLIRQPVSFAKAGCEYDVLDPATQETLMEAREVGAGFMTKLLRFSAKPFEIRVRTPDGQPVIRVSKGWSLASYQVTVVDGREKFLGRIERQKVSILDRLWVDEATEQRQFSLNGDRRRMRFEIEEGREVLGEIRKELANPLQELFTSSDHYVLSLDGDFELSPAIRKLLIASVICIDLVFHE